MKNTERLIGILDSESENRRLELVLDTDGTPRLALKLATYAEGLGWHSQKTIYIEAEQAEEMHFLLGGARHLLKQAIADADQQDTTNETAMPIATTSKVAKGNLKVMDFAASARRSA